MWEDDRVETPTPFSPKTTHLINQLVSQCTARTARWFSSKNPSEGSHQHTKHFRNAADWHRLTLTLEMVFARLRKVAFMRKSNSYYFRNTPSIKDTRGLFKRRRDVGKCKDAESAGRKKIVQDLRVFWTLPDFPICREQRNVFFSLMINPIRDYCVIW